jgi:hypothetical protein
MNPLVFIQLGLQALVEALKAWNGLKEVHRDQIVATWIADDAARRAWWGRLVTWWEQQFAKIQPPPPAG